jgi:hypothetical protein
MRERYIKQIDLIDLFIDWISHWRSLFVMLIISVIISAWYIYTGGTVVKINNNINPEQLASSTTLGLLTDEQIKQLTLEEMEQYFLTEKDVRVVDDIIELNDSYMENVELYNDQKDSLKLSERAEIQSNLADAKNVIETRRALLTADQQAYYFAKIGVGRDELSEEGSARDEASSSNNKTSTVKIGPSKKVAVLIVIVAFILHFLVVSTKYIFGSVVRHTDSLSSTLKLPEYTRMYDWNRIDAAKGLDKLVNRARFSGVRKTSLEDTVEINALATIQKLKNKNYNSVAVVGNNMDDDRAILVHQIQNDSENLLVKSIDSITHSVNGADEIAGVDSAILAVRVGVSRYSDLFEEITSLEERGVDVIGVAVFE